MSISSDLDKKSDIPLRDKSKKNFTCNTCGLNSNRRRFFIRHVNTHTGGGVTRYQEFRCEFCDFITITPIHLKAHKVRLHSEFRSGFPCIECSFRGRTKFHTACHMKRKHRDNRKDESGDESGSTKVVFPCHMCSFTGKDRTAMVSHWEKVHKIQPEVMKKKPRKPGRKVGSRKPRAKRVETKKEEGLEKKNNLGVIYPCHLCPFKGTERSDMAKHWEEVHAISTKQTVKVKPYVCRVCHFETSHLKDMLGHIKISHQIDEPDKDPTTYLVPVKSEIQPGVIIHDNQMLLEVPLTLPNSDSITVRFEIEDDPVETTPEQPTHLEPDPIATPDPLNRNAPLYSLRPALPRAKRHRLASPSNNPSDVPSEADIVICDYFTGAKIGKT